MYATTALVAVLIAETHAAKLTSSFPSISYDDQVDLSQVASTYENDCNTAISTLELPQRDISQLLTQSDAALSSELSLMSDAVAQGFFEFVR